MDREKGAGNRTCEAATGRLTSEERGGGKEWRAGGSR